MNKNGSRKQIAAAVKIQVLQRHDGKCVNCGSTEELEIHHVVPLEIGGNDTADNMVPLCYYCHKAVTHHELILKTVGRKHEAGGRPRKIPDNYVEILDRYFRCEFGAKKCGELLGLSKKAHLSDNVWYKEYMQARGIKTFRNNIDKRLAIGSIAEGDPVGKIFYRDDTSETIIYAQRDMFPDKAKQIEFNFNNGSAPTGANEYRAKRQCKNRIIRRPKGTYEVDVEWWEKYKQTAYGECQ